MRLGQEFPGCFSFNFIEKMESHSRMIPCNKRDGKGEQEMIRRELYLSLVMQKKP